MPSLIVHFPSETLAHRGFLDRLRADARLKSMPLVMLTPRGVPCERTEALSLGPVIYLPLPEDSASFDALIIRLRDLLPEV